MSTSKPSPHDHAEPAGLGASKLIRSILVPTCVLVAGMLYAGPGIALGATELNPIGPNGAARSPTVSRPKAIHRPLGARPRT